MMSCHKLHTAQKKSTSYHICSLFLICKHFFAYLVIILVSILLDKLEYF